ncbi:MAG: hypothetical protein N3D11_05225 [Candidatus Sumerlaeia bacterium]|nr:hypothetical protein [Candidatus Sumerlaeia bacterium]
MAWASRPWLEKQFRGPAGPRYAYRPHVEQLWALQLEQLPPPEAELIVLDTAP